MREAFLITVFIAETCSEAEAIIDCLRSADLHPAELALTAPCPFEHDDARFPVEVPVDEADKAWSTLEKRSQMAGT